MTTPLSCWAPHTGCGRTGVARTGLRPFHDARTEADRLVRGALDAQAYATAFEQGANVEDPFGLALNGCW